MSALDGRVENLLHIPFELDFETLRQKVRVKTGSPSERELQHLAQEAVAVAKPKAGYRVSTVDARGEDHVIVDRVQLTSRVLRANLQPGQSVFPYLATCGLELEAWSNAFSDILHRYWAETIKEMALDTAYAALTSHLLQHHHPGKTAGLSPGSIEDWQLTQQEALFNIFGSQTDALGVQLTPSMLMLPTKTVSGIRFPSDAGFESCQLCPRQACPRRRADYDECLYIKYQPEPVPAPYSPTGGVP
ncbi:MAG: hypothetical protein U1B80_00890 [Anaerolineaceae bacterium]|nr:hypothetical protein [Anaerolineaceae bacterium]